MAMATVASMTYPHHIVLLGLAAVGGGIAIAMVVIQPAKNGSEEWRPPQPTDLIFPKWQRELFRTILDEEDLRFDREGQPRTAYSLRHTYICFRLMEGADIYQIAKNCRASVEMIEKYYATQIKTNLDAAEINKMRPRPNKKQNQPKTRQQRNPDTDV